MHHLLAVPEGTKPWSPFSTVLGRRWGGSKGMSCLITTPRPIAFVRNGAVFTYGGSHLGTLNRGFIRDRNGDAVAFMRGAAGGPVPPGSGGAACTSRSSRSTGATSSACTACRSRTIAELVTIELEGIPQRVAPPQP